MGLVSKSSQAAVSAFSRSSAVACEFSAMIGMSRVALSRQVQIHQDQIGSLAGSHRAPARAARDCTHELPLPFVVLDDNDAARPAFCWIA